MLAAEWSCLTSLGSEPSSNFPDAWQEHASMGCVLSPFIPEVKRELCLFLSVSYPWSFGDYWSLQPSGPGLDQSLLIAFSGFYGKHSVWMIDTAIDATLTVATEISAGLRG